METNQIDYAIELLGGTSDAVRKLKLNGHATVYQWRIQGRVPAKYCPDIEVLTGIPCELLNADVPWALIRGTKAQEKEAA
jgi:DNA-binding transcriptional regulator YdaS (Cro superfamily)